MPKKRTDYEPRTEVEVLQRRVDRLERQVQTLSGAQRSTAQTSDYSKHLDPVQGEMIVNHPGVHNPANNQSGFVYYHDGQWRDMGGDVRPAFRLVCDHYVTVGNGTDEFVIDWDYVQNSDSSIFALGNYAGPNTQIIIKQSGIYSFSGGVNWRSVGGTGLPNGPTATLLSINPGYGGYGDPTNPATDYPYAPFISAILVLISGGDTLFQVAQHAADGLDHDVEYAELHIVRLASTDHTEELPP